MSTLFFIALIAVILLAVRTVLRHRSSWISVRGFGVSADARGTSRISISAS